MTKYTLDLRDKQSAEEVHEYLAEEMEFPSYYGGNLDALYDVLTDIGEDTCVGIYAAAEDPEMEEYLERVCQVFTDAEEDNDHLEVFVLM